MVESNSIHSMQTKHNHHIKVWNRPVLADSQTFQMNDVFAAGERNHHISNTAYPIAHSTTWKPYRIAPPQIKNHVQLAFEGLDAINLYSHIPFCETRCYFCEYTVVGQKELNQTVEYMQSLNQEVLYYRSLLGPVAIAGFDIGGGTPSFVSSDLIAEHLELIHSNFRLTRDCEISIETTPKIASNEAHKLKHYHNLGIRRISMGIQVAEPNLLKILGRSENGIVHHSVAMEHIRDAGFQNVNLDLMYGFANQDLNSWEHTLLHAINLKPESITLYRMRYKLTRISEQMNLVSLKQVRDQAKLAKQILTTNGYYANPGKNTYTKRIVDTGTSTYLTKRVICGTPYLGIGLGAQSFTHTSISYNSGSAGKNLSPYINRIQNNEIPIQDFYDLPATQMMAKMIAVSFYFGEINLYAFESKFGVKLEIAYPDAVPFVLSEGLMEYTSSQNGSELSLENGSSYPKDCLSLTEKGALHFNGTIALFFAPSIQSYLIGLKE